MEDYELEESEYSEELIKAIKAANEKCPGQTFYAFNGYFTLREGSIAFLYDQYGDGPKGAGHIPTYSGLKKEEEAYLAHLLTEYGIDVADFSEQLYGACPFGDPADIDVDSFECDALNIYDPDDEEEQESYSDDAKKYLLIKTAVERKETKYSSIKQLLEHLYRYGLSPNELYYAWEGMAIEIYDNTTDSFDSALDAASEEEWLEVLNNIESYIANP